MFYFNIIKIHLNSNILMDPQKTGPFLFIVSFPGTTRELFDL